MEELDIKEYLDRDAFVPQHAELLACLCSTNNSKEYVLILRCYPLHESDVVWRDVTSRWKVVFHGVGTSHNALSKGDEVFVSLPDGFSPTREQKHVETTSIK